MQRIHVNLVSDQLIPNLIPTLSDRDCIGVVLVMGDNSRLAEAERLASIYQAAGKPVLWYSKGQSSTKFPHLLDQANTLLERLQQEHPEKQWILNATCGTKPMSLAFANVFNNAQNSLVIYTDTQNREIPVIKPGVNVSLPFRSVLDLEQYLLANHFELESAITPANDEEIQQRRELTFHLASQLTGKCQYMLGELLWLANAATQEFPRTQHQKMNTIPKKAHADLYQRLNDAGLVSWAAQSREITFTSEAAARYLGGCWLEEFTYLVALDCNVEYVAMNVQGHWLREIPFAMDTVENEFDVLLVHNNQLLTIECKSGQFIKEKTKDQEIINKLDLLSQKLGGLFGKKLLVCAQQLTEPGRARAKQNRIACCESATQKSLAREINHWLSQIN